MVPHLVLLVSGAAALIYQIVWVRQFGRLFGHTVNAAAVVVAVYFCGMGLGYLWAARRAHGFRRPLRVYGLAESLVAAWALTMPLLLGMLSTPAIAAFLSPENSVWQIPMRTGVAVLLLLPATIPLGATLPLVTEHLRSSSTSVVLAYSANTAGAVLGVVLATFYLLPSFGITIATYVAAGLSLACALAVLPIQSNKEPRAQQVAPQSRSMPMEWQWASGVSGFATLALQIAYARLLSLLFRNSTYSFGVLIASFLIALAGGGYWVSRRGARTKPHRAAAFACLACAVLIPLSVVAFVKIGGLQYLDLEHSFAMYALIASAISLAVVGPAVVVAGVVLPLSWLGASKGPDDRSRVVGRLTAINTFSATAGALVASFVMLPILGLWGTFAAISGLYALLGAGLFRLAESSSRTPFLGAGGIVIASTCLALLGSGHRGALNAGERVVGRWTSAYGPIDVVEEANGALRMQQNLHYQYASSRFATITRRQAYLPLALHPSPRSVLFLGLASGITAGAALDDPRVERVAVVELIPEVVSAARYFAEHNRGIVDDPRTSITIGDARHYLYAGSSQMDLIVGDLFVPWHSLTGYLYTVGHFRSVRRRLSRDGLFCQWLPLWQLSEDDLVMIADSLATVFPRVSLWRGEFGGKRPMLALIASNDAIALSDEALRERLGNFPIDQTARDRMLVNRDEVPQLYIGDWSVRRPNKLNTDEHPRIEFSAPLSSRGAMLVEAQLRKLYEKTLMHLPSRHFLFGDVRGEEAWNPQRGRQRQLRALQRY